MNATFIGRKRSGKTTLAFDIAMREGGGIIIFDPKKEWRGWPGTVSNVSQIEAKIKEENAVIVFHPDVTRDLREQGSEFVRMLRGLHQTAMEKNWDKAGFHFTAIIDEAHNLSGDNWVDPDLLSLSGENRPEILHLFLTFQSPRQTNNGLKTNMHDWFVFNTSLPADLKYLNEKIGVPSKDIEQIATLHPHEYAHFFFDGGSPQVTYDYDADMWFRPLEYFELNAEEREDTMARRDEGELQDLFEDFMDFLEDRESDRGRDRDRGRGGRDRGRDRDRDRGRNRERSFSLTGRDRD